MSEYDELKQRLLDYDPSLKGEWTSWDFQEDENEDALTDAWLDNETSYIFKVCVMTAIDANKCDWAYVAIGTKRHENSNLEIKGILKFDEGENDDMGEVIARSLSVLKTMHPAFETRD